MARVNITVPDDVLAGARAAGLNVSRVASSALAEELERRAKVAELDRLLDEWDAELGPISPEDAARAKAWGDEVFGPEE